MSKRALRDKESKQSRFPWYYAVFIVVLLGVFAYLIFGLYRLQINKGEDYAASAASSAVKNIVVKGTRGMITDCDGVILARSEETYNVTFYRTTADKNYGELTKSILSTIEIIENGGVTQTMYDVFVAGDSYHH